MRRAFSLIVAAMLAVPALSSAQEKAGFTFTPYGFALLNSYWNAGIFTAKDNPGTVRIPSATTTDAGGAFLMMARYSRLGFRLGNLDSGILGGELSGVLEMDWGGGYIPSVVGSCTGTTCSTGAQVSAWQAPLLRLRLASGTLAWKTEVGQVRLLIGQDYGLIGPVFAQTLAYVGAPIFVAAGKIYRRTPEVRLTFLRDTASYGFSAAVAALNPNETEQQTAVVTVPSVDFSSGNRSRVPDLEGRVGVTGKFADGFNATFGLAYHSGWRRFIFANTTGHLDRRATTFGGDLIANLTKFFEFRGEWYQSKGNEDGQNGGFPGTNGANAASTLELVHSTGWWFQTTFKPLPEFWVAFGHGIAKADKGNLTGDARYQNEQTHVALFLNASKNVRMSAEAAAVTSTYITSGPKNAQQYSLNGQFLF